MRERFSEIFRSVREWWQAAARKTRILVLAGIAGILLVSLVIVLILNYKNYALLYNGVSTQENAQILVTLREMNIEPRISNTGAIYVEEKQIGKVRMQLAEKGFEGNTFDYSIYNQGSMTSTQAERNQRLIFQTQDRLQDTIKVYDEVEAAVVTISSPQPSIYVLQDASPPPSANVTVKLKPGRSLTASQVQAILNLVRTSVPGLTEDNIAVSDGNGDLKYLTDTYQGGSASKLDLTEKVNRAIRDRLLEMLYPVYGRDNIVLEVHSVLDTDRRTSQRTEYFPYDEDNPDLSLRDYEEITREKIGGAAGPVEGVVGANDNIDVPQYQARDVDVEDADSYVARDVIDYLVGSLREEVVREGYIVTEDTSVAVIVNTNDLSSAQRSQLIDSVSKASGIPADNVSVQNVQFLGLPEYVTPAPQGLTPTEILVISLIGFLALAIIITMIVMAVSKKRREAALAAEAAALAEYDESALLDIMGQEEAFEPIVIPETQETKLKAQIRDLADSDPEIVAQLLKSWLISG